jgi:polysaccharide export outer membrane protein
MRTEWLFALAVVLALGQQPVSAQTPATSDSGLKPGDMVLITIWQRDELSGEFIVAPDGTLVHPLYRQVRVTGVPSSQVEERVRSFLSAYEANPQLVVQPHYKVAVGGAVMKADLYDILPGTTVSEAVTQAGGIAELGKRNDVRLVRAGQETRLDLTQPAGMQMLLQSGDQIFVKEKSTNWVSQNILPLLTMAVSVTNLIAITNQ